MAVVALFSWPSDGGAPEVGGLVEAGRVEDFGPGNVTTFAEEKFHLVRLSDGEFLALSMLDPHGKNLVEAGLATGPCRVPWRPDFTFRNTQGWFRNPCHGETYDLTGTCVSGPCPRGLDRFEVRVVRGEVLVDMGRLFCGPSSSVEYEYPAYCIPPDLSTGG